MGPDASTGEESRLTAARRTEVGVLVSVNRLVSFLFSQSGELCDRSRLWPIASLDAYRRGMGCVSSDQMPWTSAWEVWWTYKVPVGEERGGCLSVTDRRLVYTANLYEGISRRRRGKTHNSPKAAGDGDSR